MTTLSYDFFICAVCGEEAQFSFLRSTNEMGYADLDLRPPEMARSTIDFWIRECEGCGYCAEDLEEATPEVVEIVRGEAFAAFREGLGDLDRLATRFRTAAFIAAEQGHHSAAFDHTLHEAWVHDDRRDRVRAAAARLNAVDHMHQVQSELEELFRDGADAVVEADLLRRAGEFERAEAVCREALDAGRNENVTEVLEFELELCAKEDADCHTLGEVFERDSGRPDDGWLGE